MQEKIICSVLYAGAALLLSANLGFYWLLATKFYQAGQWNVAPAGIAALGLAAIAIKAIPLNRSPLESVVMFSLCTILDGFAVQHASRNLALTPLETTLGMQMMPLLMWVLLAIGPTVILHGVRGGPTVSR